MVWPSLTNEKVAWPSFAFLPASPSRKQPRRCRSRPKRSTAIGGWPKPGCAKNFSTVTPERWREIEQLFHSALEHAPDERAVFLDHACADPAMRKEVEAL